MGRRTARERWLEERRNGLGGSDAPIVMGLKRWRTRHTLFLDKAGLLPVSDADMREEAYWGTVFEKPVAERYSQVTGRTLLPGLKMYRSREHTFMFANTDRLIKRDDGLLGRKRKGVPQGAVAVYEGKTVGLPWASQWENGRVALDAAVQLQHYLYVGEFEWGSFGALIGGQRLVWADMDRNDRFIKAYVKKAEEFWDRVLNNDPPPMEGHPSERRALDLLYPTPCVGKVVDLSERAVRWSEELERAVSERKAADERKDMYETLLRGAIGDALYGRFPDGSGYKLALERTRRHVRKASSRRVLRKVKRVA